MEAEENLVRHSLGRMMLTSDGADHDRQRAPFDGPFRMREVGELFGAAIAAEADVLLDELGPRGGSELSASFAAPFAVRMTGRVLGLSLDDVPRIDGFYSAFAGAMVYDGNPEPQRLADAARAELNAILHGDLARCRHVPDASVTSRVANEPEPGVTDDEAVAQLRVIMFGGIETIQSGIMNTLLLLLRDPEALAAVRDDRELLPNAIEESLRLIPPVAFIERWTEAPTAIGERSARRGRVRRRLRARRQPRRIRFRRSAPVQRPPRERASPPRVLVRRALLPRRPPGAARARDGGRAGSSTASRA